MICYRGTTYCTGGEPRCLMWGTCSRALTPEVQAEAKKAGLPLSTFAAPTAMPCYNLTPPPEAEAEEEKPDGRLAGAKKRKDRFQPLSVPDDEWRRLFAQPLGDQDIALKLGCSFSTVRNQRRRLGLPHYYKPGQTRHMKYTEADALRVIYARQGDEPLHRAARRAGVNPDTLRHLRDRFPETFEKQGL